MLESMSLAAALVVEPHFERCINLTTLTHPDTRYETQSFIFNFPQKIAAYFER